MNTDLSLEFSTEIPDTANIAQGCAARAIAERLKSSYVLEFSKDHESKSPLFFSLMSPKGYEQVVTGTIGRKGAIKTTVHPLVGTNQTRATGRRAWIGLEVHCFERK